MGNAENSIETIPKSIQHDEPIDLTMSARKSEKKHQIKLEKLNNQHSCMRGGVQGSRRKSSKQIAERQVQFINALSAPKRILNNITIEPLAFLTIVALCIEFPSIQDLIYTKVCLQLVANEPNSTFSRQIFPHPNELDLSRTTTTGNLSTKILSNVTNFKPSNEFERNLSNQLPSNGRIQQPTNQHTDSQQQTPINFPEISRGHLLCYGLNKAAIPKEIKQKIADVDSYFWLKYQLIICFLCSLSSPYWGGVSDRIGRIIPLNVPIVMSALSNLISLIFGILISFDSHNQIKLEWLYLGAVLVGISGGQAVVIVSLFSFISDNTSSENRSKRIAILESVIYLAHSIGFYLTKHLMSIGLISSSKPWLNRHFVAFSSSVLLSIICVLYSILKLRHQKFHRFLNNFEREQQENFAGDLTSPSSSSYSLGTGGSVEKICKQSGTSSGISAINNSERSRELTLSTPDDLDGPIARADKSWADWGSILTFKYYKQTFVTATKRRVSRNLILSLLLCGFISAMSLASLLSLLYIYLHSDPFNWTTSQYSSWNSISSITRGAALISLSLSMKFLKGWNVPDPIIAAIGFLSKGTGLFMIALAKSSTIIDWALLAFIFSEFTMPPLRSLLSKLVAKEEVGKIYSCLAAMQSVCFLVGNIVFYLAYTSLDLHNFFRLSFLVVGCFQYAAVIIMLLTYNSLRHRVILV